MIRDTITSWLVRTTKRYSSKSRCRSGRQQPRHQVEQRHQDRRQRGLAPAPADRRREEQEDEEDEIRAGVALGQEHEDHEQQDVDRMRGTGELCVEPPIVPRRGDDGGGKDDVADEQRVRRGRCLGRLIDVDQDGDEE